MTNSTDPDQTAPLKVIVDYLSSFKSSLICIYTIGPSISGQIDTVNVVVFELTAVAALEMCVSENVH